MFVTSCIVAKVVDVSSERKKVKGGQLGLC